MYIQSEEGKQYSFTVEVSSKDITEQNLCETISFFDKATYKEKETAILNEKDNIDLPVRIFREGNHGLQAIVKFLKDEKSLSFSKISSLIGRDQRTIWCAYNQINKKSQTHKIQNLSEQKIKLSKKTSEPIFINSSVFKERNFSILETVAINLLNKFSVKETASLLGKKQSTIWTVKRRASLKEKIQVANPPKLGTGKNNNKMRRNVIKAK